MNIFKTIWKLPTKVWVFGFVVLAYAVYDPEPVKTVAANDVKVDVKVVKTTVPAYKSNPLYAKCYDKVTQAHKDNGLHDRNRMQSIQIKEQICKVAVTSTTGEGSYWIQ